MIKKWDTISERTVGNFKIFDLSWIKRRNSDLNKEGEFVVLKSPQWVNIIPVTSVGNVVLIEQYRHGTDEITLEVPGGLVEKNENPRIAAQRECQEETGFAGNGEAELLGENIPNPAFLTNTCHSYVWFNCKKVSGQKLDRHEDINVIEVPLTEIKKMILEGRIKHSLVLTAFFFYFLKVENLTLPINK
jgi:8-oxo-dGTP pyrophosphatase MutT (NUDIX family)